MCATDGNVDFECISWKGERVGERKWERERWTWSKKEMGRKGEIGMVLRETNDGEEIFRSVKGKLQKIETIKQNGKSAIRQEERVDQ